jgi:hypothetical protein
MLCLVFGFDFSRDDWKMKFSICSKFSMFWKFIIKIFKTQLNKKRSFLLVRIFLCFEISQLGFFPTDWQKRSFLKVGVFLGLKNFD